jgi:hypothetical protein
MFGSTFDGEVVNAALAAERLVKMRGLTWEDVLLPGSNSESRREQRPKWQAPDWHKEVDACMARTNLLTAWEAEFLGSILSRDYLSPKQRSVLDRIKAKLDAYKDMNF